MIADSNAIPCRSRWSVVIIEIVVIGSGCVASREAEGSYQGMRLRTVGAPNGLAIFAARFLARVSILQSRLE